MSAAAEVTVTSSTSKNRQPDLQNNSQDLTETSGKKKVLFVCSAGGHLSQLLQLRPWWEHHDRKWVTYDASDAQAKLVDEEIIGGHFPTTRNVKNTIRNIPLARRELKKWRPDVVISNGAGVAVPFFMVAKMMGIPTVYIEVYDRVDSQTLTGKLCQPFTSLFLAQWPEQQQLYPDSKLIGPLY